ncbi:MAG: type IV pilus modification PilV family protein [Magnetovibrionaceae bacterium]
MCRPPGSVVPPSLVRSPAVGILRGFTLIEVMVGVALTGILVIGLSTLWAQVVEAMQHQSFRQRAIFALSNETERLAALYAYFDPSNGNTQTVDVSLSSPESSIGSDLESREIYAEAYAGSSEADFMITTGAFSMGQVFFFDNGTEGISEDDRLLVWLDQSKRVVGLFSWRMASLNGSNAATIRTILNDLDASVDVVATDAQNCSTVACDFIEAHIDYPFRYDGTSLTAMTPVGNVSLQTILARQP